MLISLALTQSGSSGMESAGKIIIPNNQTSIIEFIIMSVVKHALKLGKKILVVASQNTYCFTIYHFPHDHVRGSTGQSIFIAFHTSSPGYEHKISCHLEQAAPVDLH